MITPIVLEQVNEVYLKTSHITVEQALELKEYLKYYADQFWFDPKYKAGTWDGSVSFYHMNDGLLPIGLLPDFDRYCKKFNYQYKFDFDVSDLQNDISHEELTEFYKAIFKNTEYYPRDYQDHAIYKALRNKRGVIEHPTASGKSITIYTLIRFILGVIEDAKILLVVPAINLVEQMYKDFSDYGWESAETYCSLIHGKSKKRDLNNSIIISTWQSIYEKSPEFFSDFDAVIVDETHGAAAKSIRGVLEKCINAQFRIGVTGTLQEDQSKLKTIFAYLGPIIAVEKGSELIEKGYMANVTIANLLLKYPSNMVELTKFEEYDYNREIDMLYSYNQRNKILNYIIDKSDKNHNILILCAQIGKQLKPVEDYIKENFKEWKLNVIWGKVDVDDREDIRQDLIKEGGNLLLASYGTMAQGVNIPRLHQVIFLSSYKSKIKVLQSIGRGLRLHETKEKLIVWDIVDDLTYKTIFRGREVLHKNYVYAHWLKRLSYYNYQGYKYLSKQLDIEKL